MRWLVHWTPTVKDSRSKVSLWCQTCPPSEGCPNETFQRDEKIGAAKILAGRCVCNACGGSPQYVEVCQKQVIQFMNGESNGP